MKHSPTAYEQGIKDAQSGMTIEKGWQRFLIQHQRKQQLTEAYNRGLRDAQNGVKDPTKGFHRFEQEQRMKAQLHDAYIAGLKGQKEGKDTEKGFTEYMKTVKIPQIPSNLKGADGVGAKTPIIKVHKAKNSASKHALKTDSKLKEKSQSPQR